MKAGYYRSRIQPQGSHFTSMQLRVKDLLKVPSGIEPATFRSEGTEHHQSATTPLSP